MAHGLISAFSVKDLDILTLPAPPALSPHSSRLSQNDKVKNKLKKRKNRPVGHQMIFNHFIITFIVMSLMILIIQRQGGNSLC